MEMDFSRLPDDAFLKLFKYLTLEECIRIGRVNKTFRRISQYVTSQTTFLNLTEDRFRNLTADHLAVILKLCLTNLKEIKFPIDIERAVQLVTTLANYRCPKLACIDLWEIPIDNAVFEQLIRNNPNIKSLYWLEEFVGGFPNITFNCLKVLDINVNGDTSLQTLIGRCPNLDNLDLTMKNITSNVLDELFASTQQLQKVRLGLWYKNSIVVEHLVFFWNLPLTYFVVDGMIAKDSILQKVATSFLRLRTLIMEVFDITNHNIAALAVLQELENLEIRSDPIDPHVDGIRELVACKKLRWLNLSSSIITPATLIALLRGCPELKCVIICAIGEVETPEEAAIVLGSLSGITKRDIAIIFHPYNDEEAAHKFIWESGAVKGAITNLEEGDGLKVKIDWHSDGLDEAMDYE